MIRFSTLILTIVTFLCSPAVADERILSYQSNIEIFTDGDMQVEDKIRVRVDNKKIKRGIYRDFPTRYKDKVGNNYHVKFDVLRVLRDGQLEPFHTKAQNNGVRLYVGHENYQLPIGEYEYTIVYKTNRQLGFFENHDELYWNVTGNGWIFPIDNVEVNVILPQNIPTDSLKLEAFTGKDGAAGRDYQSSFNDDGDPLFVTSRTLQSFEGLTVVVTWPKGYIKEPDLAEKIGYVLDDNFSLLLGLVGLMIIFLYYYLVWHKVGKDPDTGVIFPHYTPESGFSPASMRYISRMGYDHKTFATAIVNLAAKGALEINDSSSDVYSLIKCHSADIELAAGESILMQKLFAESDTIILKNTNHQLIAASIAAHKKSLKQDYNKIYFKMNTIWLLPGFILSAVFIAIIFLTVKSTAGPENLFMLVWLSGWTLGVVMIVKLAIKFWRSALSGKSYLPAIGITLFALPFVSVEIFVITKFQFSIPLVLTVAAIISLNMLFYHWLKAPTRIGRKLLDKIDGFKMYLEVAEKDELNLKNPPEKTPEIFESYLAFAMALDVEQQWAEKFTAVFLQLQEQGKVYQPVWYHGSHWNAHNLTNFTSSVGSSLSSAISSSSMAPGSSSGSGGGGFSGGGGGGGGGGGW
ncbi:MAG: DUF2207 domain-containing protein [Gammaproteobacteria bacterium]|nr:DUF2207 domain-containing protein [Gammaproteobacteria bacterium]